MFFRQELSPSCRVAVTGSRGKSSVVRLLHRAFLASGLCCRSRETGLIPRELTNQGETVILRPSGSHVQEMKWWLETLPRDTEAIVMENSAVEPEFQSLCARWLKPVVTVLTNLRPDHQAAWGNDESHVLQALAPALPPGGTVVLPSELASRADVAALAEKKKLALISVTDHERPSTHVSLNRSLALATCRTLGFDEELCCSAMMDLEDDAGDFSLLHVGQSQLAFGFAANDVVSSEQLFQGLNWNRSETTVLYNHRRDRADRLAVFAPWLRKGWKECCIIGDCPAVSPLRRKWLHVASLEELATLIAKKKRVFGCGNAVYGQPLRFRLALQEGRLSHVS